jgi:hypothetical protein
MLQSRHDALVAILSVSIASCARAQAPRAEPPDASIRKPAPW